MRPKHKNVYIRVRKVMTPFRNLAVQAAATLALSGILGIALYGFVDYAMQGVVL